MSIDFQTFINCVDMPSCVMAVERDENGFCGDIRIIASNAAYKNEMGPSYYDGMLYHELVPKDNKFEDYCYRAAFLKQRMHAYVETVALNAWTDQTLIPLVSDRENVGYCQFTFEFTRDVEAERLAAVSARAAESVIKAGLTMVSSDDFQKSVDDVLSLIMKEYGARGAQILLIDNKQKQVINFCEKLGDDVEPVHEPGEEVISYGLIRTWEEVIGVSNELIIKDEQDMKLVENQNPEWAASMRAHRVHSLVLIPLRRDKEVVGYMYLINFDVSRIVEIKELMEVMSFILGAEIYNYQLLRRLEKLSQVDALTGLRNRRAMVDRLEKMQQERDVSFGVVNIDLNGLKMTNDQMGHEAGDRVLIQTGEILGKIFYHNDLFRTGGDEFIVLTKGITREVFDRKVARLRSDMEKNADVSFAIGDYWSDGSVEINEAFRKADDKMYADKKCFYDHRPWLVRR